MSQKNLNQQLISQTYWYAKQFAKQLGIAGLLGAGLMLACALFYTFEFIPEKQQYFEAQQQLAELKDSSNPVAIKLLVKPVNPEAELANFYNTFPNPAELSASLKLIQQAAIKNKLLLNRGDYKFTFSSNSSKQNNRDDVLARYEIELPISGQYVHIRNFIDEVMLQQPTLALSEMQLKRENSLAPDVEGRLRFVLFVKGGTWR